MPSQTAKIYIYLYCLKVGKAVIVSGDGDFYCLVDYLIDQKKMGALLIPNRFKYSGLLKTEKMKAYKKYIDELKNKIGK